MSDRWRTGVALGALGVLLLALLRAVASLPGPAEAHRELTGLLVAATYHQRHVTDAVSGVTFDVRAIDTLGEELILFVAAIGTAVVLRAQRSEDQVRRAAAREAERRAAVTGPLRTLGALLVGPLTVLGIYTVTHGALTPGGGFQGGVLLAAVALVTGTAGQAVALERLRPVSVLEVTEAAGVAAFVLLGLGGLVFAGGLLANGIALGTTGQILSGGAIPLLSIATGIEVTGALALVLTELFDQTLLPHGREPG